MRTRRIVGVKINQENKFPEKNPCGYITPSCKPCCGRCVQLPKCYEAWTTGHESDDTVICLSTLNLTPHSAHCGSVKRWVKENGLP